MPGGSDIQDFSFPGTYSAQLVLVLTHYLMVIPNNNEVK